MEPRGEGWVGGNVANARGPETSASPKTSEIYDSTRGLQHFFHIIRHSALGARKGDGKSLPRGEGFRAGVT